MSVIDVGAGRALWHSIAFYMGGNAIMNGPSQLRMVLNALIAMPRASVPSLPDL